LNATGKVRDPVKLVRMLAREPGESAL
jgi:hypothetical protein